MLTSYGSIIQWSAMWLSPYSDKGPECDAGSPRNSLPEQFVSEMRVPHDDCITKADITLRRSKAVV
jgi:hypothetical protein